MTVLRLSLPFRSPCWTSNKAGAAQVDVNPLYTAGDLRHQLQDSGAETIIIFNDSTPTLAETIHGTLIRTVITVAPGDAAGLGNPARAPDPRLGDALRLADVLEAGARLDCQPVALNGEDLLFFQYTGGTTGPSKGALLTHRNMVANVAQFTAHMRETIEPGREIIVLALPLYHIFGLMLMHTYLDEGGKVILIPNPRDSEACCDAIREARFTAIPGIKDVDFSGFKLAIGGGAAVIRDTSEKWKALTGRHIKEGYGLSETSPILCVNPFSVAAFTETCGLPVPSTDIELLDEGCRRFPRARRARSVPRARRSCAAIGTMTRPMPRPLRRTGISRPVIGVFTKDGFLKIVDRKKDMVIVSGFTVYPNEVEAVVTGSPGVAECACFGMPHDRTDEALRVYVVKAPEAQTSEDQIVAHCRKDLAGYKVPRQIVFVDALPKSNIGKILRRKLADA